MTTQMIDEITKMAIPHSIKLMEEIYIIIKDKQCVEWENDSNRFLVIEKLRQLVVYLQLTGLLKQIDVLNDFDCLPLVDDECCKLCFLQLELPELIKTLQTLC